MQHYFQQFRSAHVGSIMLTLFALALLLGHFAGQAEKNPLRMDEVDLYNSIANWVRLGLPVAYLGQPVPPADDLLPLYTRQLGGETYQFYRLKPETGIKKEFFFGVKRDGVGRYAFLPHPQLYLFVHSLLYRLFPLSPDTSHLLRYFNLIWLGGTIAGMVFVARRLYGDATFAFPAALFLFATNSFAIRASILIDFGTPMACLAIWFICAFLAAPRRGLSAGLIVVVILAWFTNFGTTVAILLGALLFGLFTLRGPRPWGALLSVAAGTFAFVPIYFAFTRLFDLPFSQPFVYATSRLGGDDLWSTAVGWTTAVWSFGGWYVREIGPILVGVAILFLLRDLALQRAHTPSDRLLLPAIILAGLVSQAALRGDAFHFPKYVYFVMPALFLYIAGETLSWLRARWSLSGAGVILILVLGITSGIPTVQSLQAAGGTLYDPGEYGLVEAARLVRAAAPTDAIVLARKDVGFFTERRFIEWEGDLLTNPERVRIIVDTYGIRYAIAGPLLLGPGADATWGYWVDNFDVVQESGSYTILKKKN